VAIPEKRVPHFKPGKALRESVDARTQELLLVPESKK
jgi:integration host factor subunit beta